MNFEVEVDEPTAIESSGRELPEPPAYYMPYEPGDAGFESAQQSGHYGIMYAGDYAWDNARCTAEAYGEYDRKARASHRRKAINGKRRRSLKFHTTWMDFDETAACVRAIGGYNRFSADRVVHVLEHCPDNTRFVVGRESSPVLYLWTDKPVDVMNLLTIALPDELACHPDAESYFTLFRGQSLLEAENGDPALLRCWWD